MAGSALAIFDRVQTFDLPLRATGSKVEISVAEVRGFEGGDDPLRPVYLTDANSAFAALVATATILKMAGEITPVCIIGIGFCVGDALGDPAAFRAWQRERRVAYLPPGGVIPVVPEAKGEADRFLEALEGEIIPVVEDRFPVRREARILQGASLGALFGLYAFFERPGLFEACLAGSPAIPFFEPGLMELATRARRESPNLAGYLDVFATDNDMEGFLDGKARFVRHLKELEFPNLVITDATVSGESHVTGALAMAHRMLGRVASPSG